MLGRAVQKHHQETARPPPSQNFFSSSPPKPSSQKLGSQATINPGYRNPLKPAPAAAVNGARRFLPPQNTVSGVKRTASGLAKVLDGSFDDRPGSQQKPIALDYDENDFDSDIDLDVEEPKATVSYPKLPQQPAKTAAPKPVVYPTLPKQQQAQTSFSRNVSIADSGYTSTGNTQDGRPLESSNELPWSSSPSEHYKASSAASRDAQRSASVSSIAQARQNGPPPPKPAKRRNLPWLVEEDEDSEAAQRSHSIATTISKFKHNTESTPLAKESKTSMYPWNTTASAVKEQQKKLREETRKVQVKKNDGTDEDRRKAKSSRTRPARVFLSEEQQHVLDLVTEKKKSVFFTGSAGTGKSVLLREIITSLRLKYKKEPDRIAVTASTGLAACNVGGVTLHSFAGIGLGKEDAPELVKKIKKNQKAKHRWMRTKVLIIDEVSMVDADLFDKLEAIARQLRNNGRPFGGIQLVITGDFFQLPPVPDTGRIAKFAFDAATWNTTIEHTIGLHHVFRQKDPIFAGMLNEMREGRLTQSSIRAFQNLNRPLKFEDTLEATELFPTRNEVDRANLNRLNMLQGESYTFDARDGGAIVDKAQRDKLLSNCMAPELITLKKGSQVMLIKNIDESLVNGSIGRVLGFMSEEKFDRYSDLDSNPPGSPGGAGDLPEAVLAEQRAKNRIISTTREFPVVRFVIADGTSRDLLCQPETWKVELPNGEVQASRSQVPLILAWALSIHKAQGQTLERVKVDLGKVFEKGQAYVALSRATSMAGLQVLRFDPKKVLAHERVRNFYSNLSRVELLEKSEEKEQGKKSSKVGLAEEYEKRFVEDDWREYAQ